MKLIRMVKPKKSTQKANESLFETEDNPLTESANASLPGAASTGRAQTDTPEEDASPSPILEAITRMEISMNARFENLETTLVGVKNAVAANTSRIINLEEWHGEFDGRLVELEKSYGELCAQNKLLKAKVNDLEGRSRRQNIKIVGLPEKIERGSPTAFVSDLLPKLLGVERFPRGIKVDRAHRIGPPGNRPRIMIARIHHDTVKEEILRVTRIEGPLKYDGQRISIFPDVTAEVMKDRKEFDAVRVKLREAGIRHGFLFPARLIFTHDGHTKIFESPREAATYVDEHIQAAAARSTE